MRATKATSISSSRCPEHGPKRGKKRGKKRNSKRSRGGFETRPYQGAGETAPTKERVETRPTKDRAGDESDERSKPVDVHAYRNCDDSPGLPGERASLVCGRIRCEQASDADGIRDQDGVDQSAF